MGIHSIGHWVQVAEGGTINLPCLYTTTSNVEIDWFKDKGQNVRNSEAKALGRISIRKDRLELTNAGLEDAGTYSCRVKAWQMEDYDSITYTVSVLGKFSFSPTFFLVELNIYFSSLKGVPDRPRLRLLSTDSTSAKLELKVGEDLRPLLWCSIFHRAKFGQPEETLLPARNLNSIHITPLRCGTTYRSVFVLA